MNAARALQQWSQVARNPLATPLAISLVVHLLFYGAYLVMPESLLAGRGFLSRLLDSFSFSDRAARKRFDEIKQAANEKLFAEMLREQAQNEEIPLTFVEVDPSQAVAEAPKTAQYISTHNTVAANSDPDKDTKQPRLDGDQTKVPILYNNPKPQPRPEMAALHPAPEVKPAGPQPLQPSSPRKAEDLRTDSKPDAKSEPFRPLDQLADRTHEKSQDKPDLKKPGGEKIGELAMATPHPSDSPNKIPGSGSPRSANPLITESSPPGGERPRTLAQAYQQNPSLAGRAMHQDGGVRRHARFAPSIDAKGSPFGAYDLAFIMAVQERWYQLLEKNPSMLNRQGKVVLDFRLRSDGRITDLTVVDNSAGDMLGWVCQCAVYDPAPYARWPEEMRRVVGANYREVRFTFYYD